MKNHFDLTGKIVLVTGAYGYLGRAFCSIFAQYGAQLLATGRNTKKLHDLKAEVAGEVGSENIHTCVLDVGSEESVAECIGEVLSAFGRIDVLVNNAYFGAGKDVLSMSLADWRKGLEGSVSSSFLCTKHVLPSMIDNKNGSIINIASMYGMVAPDIGLYEGNDFYNPANYGAGKSAILQFSRYIASVYGKYGVRCNSVSPGPFPSASVREDTEFVGRLEKKVPLGRVGKPEDLQGVMLLLASDMSSYINGANIVVDGGWTAW